MSVNPLAPRNARMLLFLAAVAAPAAAASSEVFDKLSYVTIGQSESQSLDILRGIGFRLGRPCSRSPIDADETKCLLTPDRTITLGMVPVASVTMTSRSSHVTQVLVYVGDTARSYVPPNTWDVMLGRYSAATGHEPVITNQSSLGDRMAYWTKGSRELQIHYVNDKRGYVVAVHLMDRVAAQLPNGPTPSVPPQDLK